MRVNKRYGKKGRKGKVEKKLKMSLRQQIFRNAIKIKKIETAGLVAGMIKTGLRVFFLPSGNFQPENC